MRTHRVITTTVAVLAATLVGVQPASANSFTDPVGGGGTVTYNDGTDTLCASLPSSSSYDLLSMDASPVTAGRGPTRSITVHRGEKKCRSLATAYEDTRYRYNGILGYDTPCRCGSRFGDYFYS